MCTPGRSLQRRGVNWMLRASGMQSGGGRPADGGRWCQLRATVQRLFHNAGMKNLGEAPGQRGGRTARNSEQQPRGVAAPACKQARSPALVATCTARISQRSGAAQEEGVPMTSEFKAGPAAALLGDRNMEEHSAKAGSSDRKMWRLCKL